MKSVQNCNLKSAHMDLSWKRSNRGLWARIALISYSGSEFYHDGYLRSSTIVLWKLANKVVDIEHIRRKVHVRGRVVCVSEAVRVETSRVLFRSIVVLKSAFVRTHSEKGYQIHQLTPLNATRILMFFCQHNRISFTSSLWLNLCTLLWQTLCYSKLPLENIFFLFWSFDTT